MTKIVTGIIFLISLTIAGNNPRTLHAIRTQQAPVIDGYGNDEGWKNANVATDFFQRDPNEGEPARQKTEVRLLYDDDHLYIYAMMFDSSPDSIVARLARRDEEVESDYFAVGIDSYNDHQTSFIFVALPSGSRTDILNYNDGRDEDFSWDPVWELQTRILPDGWSAEMKIPLSQLRFTQGMDTWGITFIRKISRSQEESHWALIRKDVDGTASQFGKLTGMAEVKHPSLFQLLPYTVGSSEHYPRKTDREKIQKFRPNAGVDIKYGLSSNFTLDATFNPDFAQVEADPEVLNLTTFETFYPEKRPFFIEGTQILRFVTFGGEFGPGLFYSRRIGKSISVDAPDGAVITDEPRTATILGAAKFSGKTEFGTSIGALTAITDEEKFSYRDSLGVHRTQRAEPRASYNLLRVKQDFWGNSNVGGIVTAAARDGRNPAYTAGADWDVKFDNNTYRLNGFYAHSRFVNSVGELREGSAGKINFGQISGEWVYSITSDFTTRRYYINDIGFFRSPNDYGVNGSVTYRNFTPGKYFRSYNISMRPHIRWNYDKMLLFKELNVNWYTQFLNYWSLETGMSYSAGGQDPYEPRGYGVFSYPSSYFIRTEMESDYRKAIVVNVEENFRSYENGGTISNTEASVTLRPTSAMEYRLSFSYSIERDLDRFADTLTIAGATKPSAVYGKRDVDGVDMTLRSSILFAHNLSLQIYNQFFWAKGSFDTLTYGVLTANRNVIPYAYTHRKEFNRTSLITNVVLRWEYREGSTMYLVWSHRREFFEPAGYYSDFGTNIDNTFLRTSPDNVYVVKISYWMNL